MVEVDFVNVLHKSTKEIILLIVNDKNFPKPRAAQLKKSLTLIIGMVTERYVMEI